MGGQIIQCFLGQCGLQVGNAVWELACVENGLDPSGVKLNSDTADVDSGIDTTFSQTRSGRYVPRCTLIDTEPTVIGSLFLFLLFQCEKFIILAVLANCVFDSGAMCDGLFKRE
ncbi:hypothetical protein AHF37_10630 [Paragonimus kellicotti]|nr:hypothetical protein AHF37_10630 [Paragonimus kellicotti]